MDIELNHEVCCIKGCDLPSLALGLCTKHWRRNRAYGSPVALKRHGGMFRGLPAEQRFKMQYKAAENGCWLWVGGKDQDGYGCMRSEHLGQRFERAHRWSWAFHNDANIPSGANVCHACDTPACVNPAHLWLGSTAENQQDKWEKGRGGIKRGQDSARAKLTEDQATAILRDPRPSSRIAEQYGVTPGTVNDIKSRASWAHLSVEPVRAKRVSPRKGVSDKITPEIVRDIRTASETGKALAAKYGLTQQTVCDIRKRRSWAHIE